MSANKKESENYLIYVNQIVRDFALEMKKEFDLVCIGSGGGMPHDVEEIDVSFIAYHKASIDQARELEVNATEKLLEKINNHTKIRPFLREYPFKANRAIVSISFRKVDDSRYSDESVALIFQVKDKIFYKRYCGVTKKLTDLLEEPYEEALKKVQQNPSVLKKPTKPGQSI